MVHWHSFCFRNFRPRQEEGRLTGFSVDFSFQKDLVLGVGFEVRRVEELSGQDADLDAVGLHL